MRLELLHVRLVLLIQLLQLAVFVLQNRGDLLEVLLLRLFRDSLPRLSLVLQLLDVHLFERGELLGKYLPQGLLNLRALGFEARAKIGELLAVPLALVFELVLVIRAFFGERIGMHRALVAKRLRPQLVGLHQRRLRALELRLVLVA